MTQPLRTAPAAVAVAAALLFWRPTLDVFNTTKATVVVLGAIGILGAAGVTAARNGVLRLPKGAWPALGLGFVGWLLVSAVASGEVLRGLAGAPGRHGGVVLYAAAVALAMVAAGMADNARRVTVSVLLGGLVPVTAYALLQAVGADPFPWVTVEGGAPVFSTFGNVDFASAWMGIVGVLAVGVALSPDRTGPWRRAAGLLAVATAVAVMATGSLQGPVILLAGTVIVLLGTRRWPARWLAAGGAVALLLVAGLGLGPGRSVLDGALRSLETRVPKWEAGLAITGDAPLVGRGPDSYEDWFFAARAPDVAAESGLRRSVDNAHNVPIHLAAGAGVPAAVAWLGLMVVVPLAGLWHRRDALFGHPERVALAAAWAGYVVQSMVSIDVPPLASLGLLLTGLLVGTTGVGLGFTEVTVGWSARTRDVAAAGVVVLALAAVVLAVRPWRADALGWDAELARGRGDLIAATDLTTRAGRLAGWDARFHAAQGGWLTGLGRLEEALIAQTEAHERRSRDLSHALNRARLLAALGRADDAVQAYAVVAEIDPHTPAVTAEVRAAGPAPTPTVDPGEGPVIGPAPEDG